MTLRSAPSLLGSLRELVLGVSDSAKAQQAVGFAIE